MHEEWLKRIYTKRAVRSEAAQLDCLDLEIIDVKSRTTCMGLPKNTCSLSLNGGKRLTLNQEHSKMIAKKLSTHMLLTRSRKTTDVVLMFNRQKGIEVKFRPGTTSLQFNNGTSGSRCKSGLFPAEYRAAVRDKGLSIVYDKEKELRKRNKINPSTSSGTVVGEPVEPKN